MASPMTCRCTPRAAPFTTVANKRSPSLAMRASAPQQAASQPADAACSRRAASALLLSSTLLAGLQGAAMAEDRYAVADKVKAGNEAASSPGNPGQTVKDEAKTNTYNEAREDVPSIRPPGLKDTLTGKGVPEKEATGSGPQTSSKY